MSSAALYAVNQTRTAMEGSSQIPIGGIVRRYNRKALDAVGDDINLKADGYYKVTVTPTLLATNAGDVTVYGYVNGAPYTGAVATGKAAAAGDPVNLSMSFIVRVKGCGCNGAMPLQFFLGSKGATNTNFPISVEKI